MVWSVSLCLYLIYSSLYILKSYFILHVKGRGITRKPQGSFILLAQL